ncbi:flagellar export chaperone FliS [Paenibacillus chartarius]|uniref:Flagellar secretion chaperone FliS n=1 Tax=Paenibacillus chartarius TaxID=747481 RepID=A0ABV6DJT0_9BACL
MNPQAQNLYLRTQVNTATPGELTLMLYNGAVKFMKQAGEEMRKKNIEGKHMNIMRAMDIIDELRITLDYKYEISNNLSALYVFIQEKLLEANMKLDQEALQVAIRLTTELRDTWVELLKVVKTETSSPTAR